MSRVDLSAKRPLRGSPVNRMRARAAARRHDTAHPRRCVLLGGVCYAERKRHASRKSAAPKFPVGQLDCLRCDKSKDANQRLPRLNRLWQPLTANFAVTDASNKPCVENVGTREW